MILNWQLKCALNRFDNVEVSLEGSVNYPAKVRYFLTDLSTGNQYALVQYYNLAKYTHPMYGQSYFHPVLRVPHCKLLSETMVNSYQLLDVGMISGHAHMVTDFDKPEHFWWDLVNQEWTRYEVI